MRHTIKDLIEIKDLHKYGGYSIDKLKELISESAMFANSRRTRALKAFENSGMAQPNAYRTQTAGNKIQSWRTAEFNITKEDLIGSEKEVKEKLRKKFKQNINFLKTETSTVSGWRNTLKKYADTIIEKSGLPEEKKKRAYRKFTSGKYFDLIWKTYNRLEEVYKDITVTGGSSKMIYQLVENISVEDDIENLYNKMAKIYRQIEDKNLEEEEEIFPEGVNLMVDYRRRRKGMASVKPFRDN